MKKKVYRARYTEDCKDLDLDIVIYVRDLYMIGGIESWTYYTCKLYNAGQITVLYKNGDEQQVERLREEAEVIRYTDQKIKCNKVIFAAPAFIDEYLYNSAKKRYLVNHCNYGESNELDNIVELPKFDMVFAVSDICRDSCKKVIPQEIFTLYNPVVIEKPKKVLKLVSATRMSERKGKEQMLKLADMLDEADIPFIWFIFTDKPLEDANPNMIFLKPRFHLAPVISECDYGVQFTKDESFGLFPVECLKCGTPVIVTDLPVFREIGIDESNAFFYDWDMNGKDVKELLKIPKVKYKAPSSDKLYKELLK